MIVVGPRLLVNITGVPTSKDGNPVSRMCLIASSKSYPKTRIEDSPMLKWASFPCGTTDKPKRNNK